MTMIPNKFSDLQEVADFLKTMDNSSTAELGFDMKYANPSSFTTHPCGTACCIGGWINYVNGTDYDLGPAVKSLAKKGGVEINVIQADDLCHMNTVYHRYADENGYAAADGYILDLMPTITPQQAARAIEILLETGTCDWDRAMKEVK